MQTETKRAEVHTNGSTGLMNGAELTRMREVAFEKNPSEPMVNGLFLCPVYWFGIQKLDLRTGLRASLTGSFSPFRE